MPQLIRLNVPFIVLLGIAAISLGLVYFFYRRTNPPVSRSVKWVLIVLRALVIFLLILLFFTPALHLYYYREEFPKIGVFVDNSASMAVKENGSSRWDTVEDVLRKFKEHFRGVPGVQWFAFNATVQSVPDPAHIRPGQGSTDFWPVLQTVRNRSFDRVFIVSDGVPTASHINNTLEVPAKVYTVPVGAVRKASDVFVQDVAFQPLVYRGQKQKITVFVGTRRLKRPHKTTVRLYLGKHPLTYKPLLLQKGTGLYSVELTYELRKVGLQRLHVTVQGPDNEANPYNNVFRFVQEVVKGKINVGLFSSAPNYDVKFVRLLLQSNAKYALNWYIEDNRGKVLQKSQGFASDSLDVGILIDFPGAQTSGILINRLAEQWAKRHPSFVLFVGPHVQWNALRRLVGTIPFSAGLKERKGKELSVLPNFNQKTNAFLALFADDALNQRFWSRVPPIFTYYPRLKTNAQAGTLLTGMFLGQTFPALFTADLTSYKLAVLNGLGFWKWHFMLQNDPEIFPGYRILLEKLLGWLATHKTYRPVLLTADKHSGNIGEPFEITVQLLDPRFQPIKKGSVIIQAKTGQQAFDLPVRQKQEGVFNARFVPPTSGRFTIVATGFQQERFLGKDSLKLEIIPVNKELIRLSPDTLFLQQLALNNGGKMIRPARLDQVLKTLPMKPRKILVEKKIDLWYRPALLILILVLISVEWTLRKRMNLV